MCSPMKIWMTLPELAEHSRLGVRTLKRAIARREHRLPSHLIEGRRLVKLDEYEAWAIRRSTRRQEAVKKVIIGLRGGCRT